MLKPMWFVYEEIRESGLPGEPPRRWEFVGTSEAEDSEAACRDVAREPGRYAAVGAHVYTVEPAAHKAS
jgi:hypothetical protein